MLSREASRVKRLTIRGGNNESCAGYAGKFALLRPGRHQARRRPAPGAQSSGRPSYDDVLAILRNGSRLDVALPQVLEVQRHGEHTFEGRSRWTSYRPSPLQPVWIRPRRDFPDAGGMCRTAGSRRGPIPRGPKCFKDASTGLPIQAYGQAWKKLAGGATWKSSGGWGCSLLF
jgi:hypothetical protein